jgi:hypothetical protein
VLVARLASSRYRTGPAVALPSLVSPIREALDQVFGDEGCILFGFAALSERSFCIDNFRSLNPSASGLWFLASPTTPASSGTVNYALMLTRRRPRPGPGWRISSRQCGTAQGRIPRGLGPGIKRRWPRRRVLGGSAVIQTRSLRSREVTARRPAPAPTRAHGQTVPPPVAAARARGPGVDVWSTPRSPGAEST